jgi:hypothetical protein
MTKQEFDTVWDECSWCVKFPFRYAPWRFLQTSLVGHLHLPKLLLPTLVSIFDDLTELTHGVVRVVNACPVNA